MQPVIDRNSKAYREACRRIDDALDTNRVDGINQLVARLLQAGYETAHAVEQSLGKALGYPEYYPHVSDVDDGTVCVGDHVLETLADEAARTIRTLLREKGNASLLEAVRATGRLGNIGNRLSERLGCSSPDFSAEMDVLDCIIEERDVLKRIAAAVLSIPIGTAYQANRYDTDDEHVLLLWGGDDNYDIRWPKSTGRTEIPDRFLQHRDLGDEN